ncbi:helix-turn-helix domain-containing protein [Pedobacter sp. PAMC26386]|nr:helix-turn-helix domain-containing protein [Pedobacter sp. PAMC26386]
MLRKIYKKLDLAYQLLTAIFKRIEEQNSDVEDELLTIAETALLFKVSHRTIRRWQANGIIRPIYIGGTVHFSGIELKKSAKMNKLNMKLVTAN